MIEYFKVKENVINYKKMVEGWHNTFVLNELKKTLVENASILELGSGSGQDLITLSETYDVVGSDYSEHFINEFKKISNLTMELLDARDINLNKKFDCIYSNKVLQHLSLDDMKQSLLSQTQHLNKDGFLFVTLWFSESLNEKMFQDNLFCTYYNESKLLNVLPIGYSISKVIYYSEIEENDSMIIIIKK